MKILSPEQIRQADRATIEREPITSLDLMERAARAWTEALLPYLDFSVTPLHAIVVCGSGNNGGDGWVIARLLRHMDVQVTVIDVRIGDRSEDNAANFRRFSDATSEQDRVISLEKDDEYPELPAADFLVDALFGSGLSRPVTGYWGTWIDRINAWNGPVFAVDLPSGLPADRPLKEGNAVRAVRTISFQVPKLSFFAPENETYVGEWEVIDIGLDQDFIEAIDTPYRDLRKNSVADRLRRRGRFDHKGTFGHALLLAGSHGKIGAATLAARAILRSGAGLVTVHVPRCGYEILQISFPEAMCSVDRHRFLLTETPADLSPYRGIGIGPGIGTNPMTAAAFHSFLECVSQPLVIDADGLNLLARNPDWFDLLPEGSILTPHPKEFSRLFGDTENSFERWELQRRKARELRAIILLKGGYSTVALPDGRLFFNVTGNPGMGTAGTGDVLTGVLTGLIAQDYSGEDAALIGVYLHGLAGNLAAEALEQESLLAGDVIRYLGRAFRELRR